MHFRADQTGGHQRMRLLSTGLAVGSDIEYADEMTLFQPSMDAENCNKGSKNGGTRKRWHSI